MAKSDNDLIFEQYFHSFTDVIEEARGRKKQFGERVKQIITDPKTGEKRVESYYEMMQRLKRQQLMQQADAEYEAEKGNEATSSPEEQGTPTEEPTEKPTEEPTGDEDVDVDITSNPIEDVGSFNFNATLTTSDKLENIPKDGMTQDILRYVEDTPSTGNEIVDYLTSKGVNETDAKNKVASLAMLDILTFYFSGEEKPSKPGIISIPELDDVDTDEDSGEDLEDYEGDLGDLPEPEEGELPLTDYSEEDLPDDEL